MEALQLNVSGACYAVFPDCPIFDHPNPNIYLLFVKKFFGKNICRYLGMKTFGWSHFFLFITLIFVFIFGLTAKLI